VVVLLLVGEFGKYWVAGRVLGASDAWRAVLFLVVAFVAAVLWEG